MWAFIWTGQVAPNLGALREVPCADVTAPLLFNYRRHQLLHRLSRRRKTQRRRFSIKCQTNGLGASIGRFQPLASLWFGFVEFFHQRLFKMNHSVELWLNVPVGTKFSNISSIFSGWNEQPMGRSFGCFWRTLTPFRSLIFQHQSVFKNSAVWLIFIPRLKSFHWYLVS